MVASDSGLFYDRCYEIRAEEEEMTFDNEIEFDDGNDDVFEGNFPDSEDESVGSYTSTRTGPGYGINDEDLPMTPRPYESIDIPNFWGNFMDDLNPRWDRPLAEVANELLNMYNNSQNRANTEDLLTETLPGLDEESMPNYTLIPTRPEDNNNITNGGGPSTSPQSQGPFDIPNIWGDMQDDIPQNSFYRDLLNYTALPDDDGGPPLSEEDRRERSLPSRAFVEYLKRERGIDFSYLLKMIDDAEREDEKLVEEKKSQASDEEHSPPEDSGRRPVATTIVLSRSPEPKPER